MHENTSSRPTIFLVEEDNQARPGLTKSLREHGYRLLVSADLKDAYEWTEGNACIHADLVLINLLGKAPEEALSIGRRLRADSKNDGNTPVVVMPEKIPQDLEGTDEKVNELEWICYYEDTEQIKRLLARLLNNRLT